MLPWAQAESDIEMVSVDIALCPLGKCHGTKCTSARVLNMSALLTTGVNILSGTLYLRWANFRIQYASSEVICVRMYRVTAWQAPCQEYTRGSAWEASTYCSVYKGELAGKLNNGQAGPEHCSWQQRRNGHDKNRKMVLAICVDLKYLQNNSQGLQDSYYSSEDVSLL